MPSQKSILFRSNRKVKAQIILYLACRLYSSGKATFGSSSVLSVDQLADRQKIIFHLINILRNGNGGKLPERSPVQKGPDRPPPEEAQPSLFQPHS